MPVHSSIFGVWVSVALAGLARAHEAAWHKSIYCLYVIFYLCCCYLWLTFILCLSLRQGNQTGVTNWNNNEPVNPLWDLTYDQWFMHAINGVNLNPFQ